jgi:hypothetical protein
LADVFCELFGNQTGGRIGGTTRRKANKKRDRALGGEVLCTGNAGHEQSRSGQRDGTEQVAFIHGSTVIKGLIVNSKLRWLPWSEFNFFDA